MTDDLREVGQQEWVPCKSHNLPKIVENLQGKACEDGNYKTYFLQTINIWEMSELWKMEHTLF